MYYFLLAFRCFFAVLFAHRLPAEAIKLLPAGLLPRAATEKKAPVEAQPISEGELIDEPRGLRPFAIGDRPLQKDQRPAQQKERPPLAVPVVPPPITASQETPVREEPVSPSQQTAPREPADDAPRQAPREQAPTDDPALRRQGAVQLLGILQREGRLVDFLMEDVEDYSDAQIGAAVRDIHRGCRKGLREHLDIAPVRPEPDEAPVRVDDGYDPSRIRLIGALSGKSKPPFHGTLRHHGWAARTVSLPELPKTHDPLVITPAEVELGG